MCVCACVCVPFRSEKCLLIHWWSVFYSEFQLLICFVRCFLWVLFLFLEFRTNVQISHAENSLKYEPVWKPLLVWIKSSTQHCLRLIHMQPLFIYFGLDAVTKSKWNQNQRLSKKKRMRQLHQSCLQQLSFCTATNHFSKSQAGRPNFPFTAPPHTNILEYTHMQEL